MKLKKNKPGSWADFLIFFGVLVAVFVLLRYPILHSPGIVSVDDFAANDLLIIDAKSFKLLHGNYSRVGFYHPGPFFFQLMAWSEQLFLDVLHVVGSPVGAHVLAALMFYAAGIAALYCAGSAYFRSRLAGFSLAWLTVIVACCVIDTRLFYNGQLFFLTSWPPFLYMGAVLYVLAGLTALMTNLRWGLPLFTAGIMMLVHGHASFVGLAPVMIVGAGAYLFWLLRRDRQAGAARFSQALDRRAVLASMAIFALFCFPIVYNTFAHWPGELPKYFSFAGKRESRSILDIGAFWWTFSHWTLLAIPVFATIAIIHPQRPVNGLFILVLVTFLPAILIFSVRGLDTLEYKYPLFWAAPMLGYLVALTGVDLAASADQSAYRNASVVFAVVFGFATLMLFKRQGVFESAPGEDFRAAVAKIKAANTPGKLVWLSVDTSQILPIVYTSTLAVQDKRLGGQSFCVTEQTWNIAYTAQYLCGKDTSTRSVGISVQLDDSKRAPLFKINGVVGVVQAAPPP